MGMIVAGKPDVLARICFFNTATDDTESYWSPSEKTQATRMLARSIIGSPETVRSGIEALVAETGADELIVVSDLYDHTARLRSFELIADAAGLERQYVQAPALAHQ